MSHGHVGAEMQQENVTPRYEGNLSGDSLSKLQTTVLVLQSLAALSLSANAYSSLLLSVKIREVTNPTFAKKKN